MGFEDNFLYPLYLLLIGACITGILVPFFNRLHESKLKKIEMTKEEAQKRIDRDREDHKMEINIKSDIIKNISAVYSLAITTIFVLVDKIVTQKIKSDDAKSTVDGESFREFFQLRIMVESLIKAYFRESSLNQEWTNFAQSLTQLWVIYDYAARKEKASDHDFTEVKKYFEDRTKFDWDKFKRGELWLSSYEELNDIIFILKSEIIQKVLQEEINTGKKLKK